MSSPLKVGTVLLREGTFVPDSVTLLKETLSPGWQAITNLTGDELDGQLRNQNWNFMFIAGAIHGTSRGSWSDVAVRRAAIRMLGKTRLAKFNGFEITGINKLKFLSFPYVTVTGHSRHLQKSRILQKLEQRIHQAAQQAPSLAALPSPVPVVAR